MQPYRRGFLNGDGQGRPLRYDLSPRVALSRRPPARLYPRPGTTTTTTTSTSRMRLRCSSISSGARRHRHRRSRCVGMIRPPARAWAAMNSTNVVHEGRHPAGVAMGKAMNRHIRMLFLVILAGVTGLISAEDRITVGYGEGVPGQSGVAVVVTGSNDAAIHGYSPRLVVPPGSLEPEEHFDGRHAHPFVRAGIRGTEDRRSAGHRHDGCDLCQLRAGCLRHCAAPCRRGRLSEAACALDLRRQGFSAGGRLSTRAAGRDRHARELQPLHARRSEHRTVPHARGFRREGRKLAHPGQEVDVSGNERLDHARLRAASGSPRRVLGRVPLREGSAHDGEPRRRSRVRSSVS